MEAKKQITVLLISSNTMTQPYPVFPLGVAFLEAALREAGHRPMIWDRLVHGPGEFAAALALADVVGISLRNIDNVSARAPQGYINEYREVLALVRSKSRAPIIAGGSAFSIFPHELMDELELDWGILGEAETALVSWVEAWAGGGRMDAIPGLVYRVDGEVRSNAPAPIPADRIPVIGPPLDWVGSYVERGGMLNIQTQRGCAFKCTYCTYPWIEGSSYRHRHPDALVREILHLHQAGVRYVFLTDSVFNTSERHVQAFCEALIREKLTIDWGCFARPHRIRSETLDLMVEAGMKHLEFGSDSFCDTTLRSYGKSFRFADILETAWMASSRSVHSCHYVIFGGPGETEQTIRETVANSRELPDAPIFAFSGMRIYPHTPLHGQSGSGMGSRQLLMPAFFDDPAFPAQERDRVVAEAIAGVPNWIASDHSDDNAPLMAALRRKGRQGPLWEYLALARRMVRN